MPNTLVSVKTFLIYSSWFWFIPTYAKPMTHSGEQTRTLKYDPPQAMVVSPWA
jgi:hypothetical protein